MLSLKDTHILQTRSSFPSQSSYNVLHFGTVFDFFFFLNLFSSLVCELLEVRTCSLFSAFVFLRLAQGVPS